MFKAADTRSRAELESILGRGYAGVLSSDDFSVYNGYAAQAQQKCLAHMRRHFKNLSKSPVLPNQEIASVFIGLIDDLFPNYHQLQISNDIETYKQWAFKFKKRKISGGSRSLERFGDTANLLTVVQTCRSQKRSVIDFLASAIKAHTRNQIIFPSLIPCSAT